jgi:hypothetical protein
MIQYGGREMTGFGVGDISRDEIERALDPLYNCHHDTYSKLQTAGAVIVSVVITAGVFYFLRK